MNKTTLAKILSFVLVVTTVFSFFTSTALANGDGGSGDVVSVATDVDGATSIDASTSTDADATTSTDADAATSTDPKANFTIEFEIGEGATGKPEAMTGKGPVNLPVSVPKREGYTFLGWTTNENDKDVEYYGAGAVYTLTEDVVLYAAWRDNSAPEGKYALIFDPNGGTDEPTRIIDSGEINLPTEEPTRAGYIFKGWATTNRAKEEQYKAGEKFNLVRDITLYAFWVPDDDATENYTLTFDANGGEFAPYEQSGRGKIYLTEAKPTKDGYDFLGWAETKTATSAQYQPAGEYDLTKDATLYAVWKQVVFTLSYNANGGSGAPASQKSDNKGNVKVSSTVPTRSGYTFLGWSKSSTATAAQYKAGNNITLTANTTLYATWKKINPSTPDPVYNIEIVGYTAELSVSYKSKLTFHAKTEAPSGYKIVWYKNGKAVTEEGNTFVIDQATADSYTVQAKLLKTSDNSVAAVSKTETVKVSTNFFARLLAVIRQLLNRLPEYVDNKKVK